MPVSMVIHHWWIIERKVLYNLNKMLNNRKCSSKTFSGRKVFLIIKFTNCDSQEKKYS